MVQTRHASVAGAEAENRGQAAKLTEKRFSAVREKGADFSYPLQGPLIRELEEILPRAFQSHVKRAGIVNAWKAPAFKAAVEATERKNLILAGVTTDVCLVYPSISAVEDGYSVQAVMDASGSRYDISEETSRRRMERAGVIVAAGARTSASF